jgi:hypothetical protein
MAKADIRLSDRVIQRLGLGELILVKILLTLSRRLVIYKDLFSLLCGPRFMVKASYGSFPEKDYATGCFFFRIPG